MEGAKNAINSIYSELTVCQALCRMLYIRHHSRSPLQFKEEKPIFIFISQREHWGSRKLRDLPKVRQLLRDRAGIQTGSLTPSSSNPPVGSLDSIYCPKGGRLRAQEEEVSETSPGSGRVVLTLCCLSGLPSPTEVFPV